MPATIRPAAESDAAPILRIYEPYVRETAISFELEPPGEQEMCQRVRAILPCFPWLVCDDSAGEIAGYAYASKHRERSAYQWSVDTAIYVDPRLHRSGVGRGLYTSLFALLRLQGLYNAYAGVALPNDASIGLHTALGFQPIGIYHRVGYKLGRWHDVWWGGLALQPLADAPAPPRTFAQVCECEEWHTALQAGLPMLRL